MLKNAFSPVIEVFKNGITSLVRRSALPHVIELPPGQGKLLKIQMDKTVRKVRNQDINPCIEETDASQKCLHVYNYDKSMCAAYFQRYKRCRKYWHDIMLQRRRDGVRPDMPTAAERQELLHAIGGKPY